MKFDQHTLFGRLYPQLLLPIIHGQILGGGKHIRSVGIDAMYIYLRSLYDIMLSNDGKMEKREGNLDIVAGSNALNDTGIFDTHRKHWLVPHTSSLAAFLIQLLVS